MLRPFRYFQRFIVIKGLVIIHLNIRIFTLYTWSLYKFRLWPSLSPPPSLLADKYIYNPYKWKYLICRLYKGSLCKFSSMTVSLPLSICINKSPPLLSLPANIFTILVCSESYMLNVFSFESCILIFDMIYHRYCLIIFLRLARSKIDQEFVKNLLSLNFIGDGSLKTV